MPFGGFNSLGEVALTYQITLRPDSFVEPAPMAVDESFRRRLEFNRLNAPVNVSEQAIAEFLIAPVLQEMWQAYSDALMIWSHVLFGRTQILNGRTAISAELVVSILMQGTVAMVPCDCLGQVDVK